MNPKRKKEFDAFVVLLHGIEAGKLDRRCNIVELMKRSLAMNMAVDVYSDEATRQEYNQRVRAQIDAMSGDELDQAVESSRPVRELQLLFRF